METKKKQVRYVAKKSCKKCWGRGLVVRTLPRGKYHDGKKLMIRRLFRCGCVREVKGIED